MGFDDNGSNGPLVYVPGGVEKVSNLTIGIGW